MEKKTKLQTTASIIVPTHNNAICVAFPQIDSFSTSSNIPKKIIASNDGTQQQQQQAKTANQNATFRCVDLNAYKNKIHEGICRFSLSSHHL